MAREQPAQRADLSHHQDGGKLVAQDAARSPPDTQAGTDPYIKDDTNAALV